MDDASFDTLVARLERQEIASPRQYRATILFLALLGYAYIGLVLVVLLALLTAAVAIMVSGHVGALFKLVLALVVAAWFILRALWVKFDPPSGRVLRRREAPTLFAEADSLARHLRAPKADVVVLNTDFNASVSQIPRLGMLGLSRSYLTIGMPLLAALPPEQVRAVLAHEFAHLSHAHGTFGSWCYRIRMTWIQLLHALEQERHWTAGIFRRFFNWYVPVFSAYTLVLMRRHEFEADELAAAIVGPSAMVQTLVDLEVRGEMLSRVFWQGIWEHAKQQSVPPDDVYARLASTTTTELPQEISAPILEVALRRRTNTSDTHPSLRERLVHLLGEDRVNKIRPSVSFTGSGTRHYLEPSADAIQRELSEAWKTDAGDSWNKHHAAVAAARDGLASLSTRPTESLSLEERFQLAAWTEEIHGADVAFPLYEAAAATDPASASASFAIGRILMYRDDERCLSLIDQAMERDADAIIPGCELAMQYLERHGRLEEVAKYRQRGQDRYELLQEAGQERSQITPNDTFVPTFLPDDSAERLSAQLDSISDIERAYIARKVVKHFAHESPMEVLLVQVAVPAFLYRSASAQTDIAARVSKILQPPSGFELFVVAKAHSELIEAIAKAAGGPFYTAKQRKAERRQAQKRPAPAGVAR